MIRRTCRALPLEGGKEKKGLFEDFVSRVNERNVFVVVMNGFLNKIISQTHFLPTKRAHHDNGMRPAACLSASEKR